nr:Gfo/Idh/MocA family oxidoreductase [Ruania zhangjianzhongii]
MGHRFGVPAFSSLEGLLTRARPDAVSVAVPATRRGDLIETVTGHGCAVLIEKPLAADGATAARLAHQLDDSRAMVGHVLRFADPYRELRATAREAGGPWRGTSSRTRPADHLDDYPSENVVGLTMIHDLDAIAWITGERVERVQAHGVRSRDGRWSSVDAHLTLSGGGTWDCHAGWDGADEDTMAVAGASLRIADTDADLTAPNGSTRRFAGAQVVYDLALRAELAHFVDRIHSPGVPTSFDLDAAAGSVRVADALLASLSEGGVQVVGS